MPFSPTYTQQYRALTVEKLDRYFQVHNPEDYADICFILQTLVDPLSVDPLTKPAESKKYDEARTELAEFLKEGFDLYATDRIIDKVNDEQKGRDRFAPWVHTPAFTSSKPTRAEKIDEARKEFQLIVKETIKERIKEYQKMSEQAKTRHIQQEQERRSANAAAQRVMAEHKAPLPGTAAHVSESHDDDEDDSTEMLSNLFALALLGGGLRGLSMLSSLSLGASQSRPLLAAVVHSPSGYHIHMLFSPNMNPDHNGNPERADEHNFWPNFA